MVAEVKSGRLEQAELYTYGVVAPVALAKAERVVAWDFLPGWRHRPIRDVRKLRVVADFWYADGF